MNPPNHQVSINVRIPLDSWSIVKFSTDSVMFYDSDTIGVSTQLQSSGLVAHENSTFRNLALAVSGPFMA